MYDGPPIFQLCYFSLATHPAGHPTDLQILRESLLRNAGLGVTGLLIRGDHWFFQIVEGPEQVLKDLYNLIERDPRHTISGVWDVGTINTRLFPEWNMALFRTGRDMRPEDVKILRSATVDPAAKVKHVADMCHRHTDETVKQVFIDVTAD